MKRHTHASSVSPISYSRLLIRKLTSPFFPAVGTMKTPMNDCDDRGCYNYELKKIFNLARLLNPNGFIPERSEREVWTNGVYLPALFSFPKLLPYFSHFPNRLLILPHPGTTQPLPSQGRIQEFWRLLGCLWMDFAKILGDYRVHG